ncbi:MAG TPA: hypothetical protein VH092_06735 [Urbifossiella sp.]|jgi:hypothetical protein|nr:hypothetical protein [Urbifossiella sp.]
MYALTRLAHAAGLEAPDVDPGSLRALFHRQEGAIPTLTYTPRLRAGLRAARDNDRNTQFVRILAAAVLAADPATPGAPREQFEWCLARYAELPPGSEDRRYWMEWYVRNIPGFEGDGMRFAVGRAEDRTLGVDDRVDAIRLLAYPLARPTESWTADDHAEAAAARRLLDDPDPRIRLAATNVGGVCGRPGSQEGGWIPSGPSS